MRLRLPRPQSPRRGVTLIEMLVTVTLLVLMMTALTQIFSAATGAVTAARTYQDLDGSLRQLDSTIRTDLQGVTARMTPPLNPEDNLGYFEYGENQFADLQGEDSDDYVRFTARAPEGQFFTGRFYLPPSSMGLSAYPTTSSTPYQPITITSQYAEIIYFLRNGNLYRRVFLIVPERQTQVGSVSYNAGGLFGYSPSPFGSTAPTVSWLGMNDVSARPGNASNGFVPILNTLGDLTNRENRAFYPRFADDYLSINPGGTPTVGPDGIADEFDGDGVPDWYPTLYPLVFSSSPFLLNSSISTIPTPSPVTTTDLLSFPYIYPGAYSVPDYSMSSTVYPMGASAAYGGIHGMSQDGYYPNNSKTLHDSPPYGYYHFIGVYPGQTLADFPGQLRPNVNWVSATSASPLVYRPNHSPLETGDSVGIPTAAGYQTWWGFPTWKETMAPFYNDPWWPLAQKDTQPNGLSYTLSSSQLLPPMTGVSGSLGYQPFNDGLGLLAAPPNTTSFVTSPAVFEDDLIMTGVRSFDIKAYDDTVPGYVDLGYSNFTGGITGYPSSATTTTPSLLQVVTSVLQGFGHEGRIPPHPFDYRFDPQYPDPNFGYVGDKQPGIIRLRRVFDTWSTDYTEAPISGINSVGTVIGGGPFNPGQRPLYPSYPPPYAPYNFVAKATDDLHTDKGVPLRGLQIQIRVVDPRSEYIKVLTIRQDFTSKL